MSILSFITQSLLGSPPPHVAELTRITDVETASARMYEAAKYSRFAAGWTVFDTSADSELHTGLTRLRALSRSLIRDNCYAKRARAIVVGNVIGAGIGLQAQVENLRGKNLEDINSAIESAWDKWCQAESCHTGGRLTFSAIEQIAMGQVFEAGEVLIRKYPLNLGRSGIPMALEVIEAERLADDYSTPAPMPGNRIKMGVEIDAFDRPVAYWIRQVHPNEYMQDMQSAQKLQRVPADQIYHLHIIDRWPQVRGVPWLHTAIRRLQDIHGYSEAEIIAARASACVMGFVTSPESPQPDSVDAAGNRIMNFEAGTIEHLLPGEEFTLANAGRNNAGMEPFMRILLREIAAGCGTSYESLSRDYSQSNYSSSRLALIEDRDNWRALQSWFIGSFRRQFHTDWLNSAVLSGSVKGLSIADYANNIDKYQAVKFKPRGWAWVDPTKEVDAYQAAVAAGFMSISDVIALTGSGNDLEDVIKARQREIDMMELAGVPSTTLQPAPAPKTQTINQTNQDQTP